VLENAACLRLQTPTLLSRRLLISQTAAGVLATTLGAACSAEALASDTVINCVLQAPKVFSLPQNAAAVVTARVVGRNTNGPLATARVEPLEGSLPLSFAITRADLREGVPDYVWSDEDIYLKVDIVRSDGKTYAEGRSKAKAVGAGAHATAYVTVE